MNPMLIKILIIFALAFCFLLFFVLLFFLYKWIKPSIIRVFQYKKIYRISEIILRSKNEDEKIKNLLKEGFNNADLVKVANLEIERVKQINLKKQMEDKNGKKDSIQQVSGGSNQGDAGSKDATGVGASEIRADKTTASVESNDSGHEGFRAVQSESTETPRRRNKYFG